MRTLLTLLAVGASTVSAACKGGGKDAEPAPAASGSSTAAVAAALPLAGPNPVTVTPGAGSDTLSDNALIARADAGRLMGRDSGAMWLIVISDFQCPYCKQWHDSSNKALKRDYVDKGLVRLGYLNLPLQQHPHAHDEAVAGLCAAAQGKFWPYADALFHEQNRIAKMTSVTGLLDSVGTALALNMSEFARCRTSRAIRTLVQSDIQQAQQANVQSTPSFLIGEFLVQGAMPYPDFKRAVDSALVIARVRAKGKT